MPDVDAGSALFMRLGLVVLAGFGLRAALGRTAHGPRLAATGRTWLNRSVLWVTMPALVFQTVHAATLDLTVLRAPAAALCGMVLTAIFAWALYTRKYGASPETGGLVLAASAGSVSFFGIPIVRELFGPSETPTAVYFAALNIPLALLVAAVISSRVPHRGAGSGAPSLARTAAQALRQLVQLPATWALGAALALHPVALPRAADGVLQGLAATVAPTTMVALGLALRFERRLLPYRMALPAVAIKLAISPLIVCVCAWALGLSGISLAVVSLQGAMPTQALSVVVAERYGLDSRLVGLTLALNTVIAFWVLPVTISGVSLAVLP